MKNIYLIGFMGAGKSTIARRISEKYGLRQLEMDEEIEHQEHMSIPEIFSQKGEAYFRRKETELLEYCTGQSDLVVSCGGGAAMREENVAEMKKNGSIVWLVVSAETVFDRVRYSHNRPLLEGNMNVAYIRELMLKREDKYRAAADIQVDVNARNLDEICDEIMKYGITWDGK